MCKRNKGDFCFSAKIILFTGRLALCVLCPAFTVGSFFGQEINKQAFPLASYIKGSDQDQQLGQKRFKLLHYADSEPTEVAASYVALPGNPKSPNFIVRSPVELNGGINMLSYCGNTSKSDWLAGACKQIHYSEQKGHFKI